MKEVPTTKAQSLLPPLKTPLTLADGISASQ